MERYLHIGETGFIKNMLCTDAKSFTNEPSKTTVDFRKLPSPHHFFFLIGKTYLSLENKRDTTQQQKSIRNAYLEGEIERIDTMK